MNAMMCNSCGRDLMDEDLVSTPDGRMLCEPCFTEGAKAEQRRDSIDAAWTAAEAAIPPGSGWYLGGVDLIDGGEAWLAYVAGHGTVIEAGRGATPALALREVARLIADVQPAEGP